MSMSSIILLVVTVVSSHSIANAASKDPAEAILKFTPTLLQVKFRLNHAIDLFSNVMLDVIRFRKALRRMQEITLSRHLRHGTR